MNRLVRIQSLAALILLMFGAVTLFSTTTYHPPLDRVCQHLEWMALSGLCWAAAFFFGCSWLRRFHAPRWMLAAVFLLLALVLVPGVGTVRNGAARWLDGGQPSEAAKLVLIIFLADYGVTHQSRMHERNTGFLLPGGVACLVVVLVFLEPDWGTAALIAAVSLVMLAIAGTHWFYLLSATIIGGMSAALLLLHNQLRLERFLAFLDPEGCRDGAGAQGWQSLLSLARGRWFGVFFGEGSQKNGFVPEQQTDFALSLLGEEGGFVAAGLVVLLFIVIVICGARIVWRVADPFGQLLAAGLTVLIGLQAFINIGVVTSSLPNKGIALPFISYGGSSLVCMMTCLGLLGAIARLGPARTEPPAEAEPAAPPGPKGPRKNNLAGYGAGILPAGEARATSIPREWVCKERATKPAGKRTSQNRLSYFCAVPKIGGPVGSLLDDPTRPPPRGLRGLLRRWFRSIRRRRFPSVPLRPYQRPPNRIPAR
jgi:cell division protein FtsW